MYADVSYCVKLDKGLTENIPSNSGVKQGCVLSPLLFNLFLHDFPDIFDDGCDAVLCGTLKMNCLMFADDLVLFSESAPGLQNCLNKLNTYTKKWNLKVNINKTKVVVFNKGGKNWNICISISEQKKLKMFKIIVIWALYLMLLVRLAMHV